MKSLCSWRVGVIQVRFLAELPAALRRAAWDSLQYQMGHDGCAKAPPPESVPVKIRRYMGRLPGGLAFRAGWARRKAGKRGSNPPRPGVISPALDGP